MSFLNFKYIFGGLVAASVPLILTAVLSNSIASGWLGISQGGTVRDVFSQYGLSSLSYDENRSDEEESWKKIGRRYMKNVTDNYLSWRRSDFFNEGMSKEFCEKGSSYPQVRADSNYSYTNHSSNDYLKNFLCQFEPGFVGSSSGEVSNEETTLKKVIDSLKKTCKKVLDMDVTTFENSSRGIDNSGFSPWNLKVRKHDAISYCTKPELISLVAEKQGYIPLDIYSEKDDYLWFNNLDKYLSSKGGFGVSDSTGYRFLSRFIKRKKDRTIKAEENNGSSDSTVIPEDKEIHTLKIDCLTAGAIYTHDAQFMNAFEAYTKFCVRKKPWWSVF